MTEENFALISKFFHDLGGPGSFLGHQKLKSALKAAGHKVTDAQIDNFLLKSKDYYRFRNKYRGHVPKYVPLRFSLVSGPHIQWFCRFRIFSLGLERSASLRSSLRRWIYKTDFRQGNDKTFHRKFSQSAQIDNRTSWNQAINSLSSSRNRMDGELCKISSRKWNKASFYFCKSKE